jgi:multidrug efflux pump subunit AcrA (membrane-fusion protein)
VDIGQKVRGPRFDSAGKEVEPGEVLAEIAIPEMEEEARQKQALVRQAEAEVEQVKRALAAADANVAHYQAAVAEARAGLTRAEAQHDRWQSEHARLVSLVQRGVIDAQSRDETENQYKAATAGWEEAKARVLTTEAAVRKARADRDRAEADVGAAGDRLEVAKAEARRLEALLQYTQIRAPFDGVVTRRRVNTGDFLQAGGGTDGGIFRVARRDPVRVVIDVPEVDAALVRDEAEVKLQVQALAGPELNAAITRTSWALEPGARTLRAEIDLANPDDRYRPGMYVYARIEARLPEGWTLPVSAVARQGNTALCYLVQGGKAVRTTVQVGPGDGQVIEVRKWQKPGSPDGWADFTGQEQVADQAARRTDGETIQVAPSP